MNPKPRTLNPKDETLNPKHSLPYMYIYIYILYTHTLIQSLNMMLFVRMLFRRTQRRESHIQRRPAHPKLLQKAYVLECAQNRRRFKAGTQKERRCFAAECGPDSLGHARAVEHPFFDPGSKVDRVQELSVALEQVHRPNRRQKSRHTQRKRRTSTWALGLI